MPPTIFRLENMAYGYQRGEELFLDFNLDILEGERVCLLGANGAGKSTLLKILCGLIFPTSGSFYAFGRKITEAVMEEEQAAKEYHRRVGFIFQNSDVQLFTTRVWDEIAFAPLQQGLPRDEIRERVEDVLSLFNIQHLRDRSPYRLSGGEKKKVAVASVLVLNPAVLILDEPTNGLDPKTQHWLVELLLELAEQGRTIITSTHNLELAHALSERALVLSEDHQLVYDGKTHHVLEDRELLTRVNLIDEYFHIHDDGKHRHRYVHG